MRSIFFATAISLGATAGVGCAAAVPPASTMPSADSQQAEAQAREHAARERELRAQLALARARTSELEMRGAPPAEPRETVRIRSARTAASPSLFEDDGNGWDEVDQELPEPTEPTEEEILAESRRGERDRRQAAREAAASEGSRPVLRLYGVPQAPSLPTSENLPAFDVHRVSAPVPPIPQIGNVPQVTPTNAHLPWETSAPGSTAQAGGATAAPARAAVQNHGAAERIDLGLESYREALGLLRDRHFTASSRAFESFLQAHPNHPQASNARYWRAELFYIQRQYGRARTAFEQYVGRHPRSAKTADALLKLALCSRRLGNADGATALLERLRRDFPTSNAARLASREMGQ